MAGRSTPVAGSGISVLREGLTPGSKGPVRALMSSNAAITNYEDITTGTPPDPPEQSMNASAHLRPEAPVEMIDGGPRREDVGSRTAPEGIEPLTGSRTHRPRGAFVVEYRAQRI